MRHNLVQFDRDSCWKELLLPVNLCQNPVSKTDILRSTGAVFLSGGGFGGRIVAATMVVGCVLSTRASAAQHCCLCWPDVQCETDPSMYPCVIV